MLRHSQTGMLNPSHSCLISNTRWLQPDIDTDSFPTISDKLFFHIPFPVANGVEDCIYPFLLLLDISVCRCSLCPGDYIHMTRQEMLQGCTAQAETWRQNTPISSLVSGSQCPYWNWAPDVLSSNIPTAVSWGHLSNDTITIISLFLMLMGTQNNKTKNDILRVYKNNVKF